MRQGRTQSRSATRNVSSSPSGNLNSTLVKKSMKLPQIAGVPDDTTSSSGNGQQSSGLVVGVCSQQGKRPYQEDEYSIRQFVNEAAPAGSDPNIETHFFGLFDGHAGGRCSNYVAGSLPNVLAEDASFFSNLPQALKRSFHQTNESFLKVAEKMKYHDGSTGITAVVRDSKVLVANVGDCRCLIISGGRPIQMSIDQKPTNPEEQKRIVALGGTVVYCMGVARVNRVLAVSRAFGNRTLRTVIRPDAEMMQRELTMDDDYIVMASDGLWDVLKNKDVCDMCYSPFTQNNPQVIADELVQSALMRGSMDNVTCIVVRLTDYVQRLFGGNRGGAGASSSLPNAGAGANQHSGQQTLFGSSGGGGGNNDGQIGTLERASSLRNVAQNSSNSGSSGSSAQGSGGLLPLSRQYSTGSINSANRLDNNQAPPLQLAPVLDNYLYSPGNSRNRTLSTGSSGGDSPGFQLPSTSGGHGGSQQGNQGGRVSPAQQGIASLRQHMHRDGSFNFEDDDQTIALPSYNNSGNNSASTSGSGSSWGASQPAMASSPIGPGANGFAQNASGGYASRRPNTMGGAASNVLGGSRASFTSGMPNLISMFNQSAPQAGAGAGNNSLLPLSSNSSPMAGSAGAGMWNSEGDYSGSSGLSESTAGSRVATSHGAGGGYSQRAGPLGTIFPINYKKPPSKK